MQIAALEKKKQGDIASGDIEAMHPGYLGAQNIFYVWNLKGVGRIHQVTFRKKLYYDLKTLQKDLDSRLDYYNNERTHQGKICNRRTPVEILLSGKEIWNSTNLNPI